MRYLVGVVCLVAVGSLIALTVTSGGRHTPVHASASAAPTVTTAVPGSSPPPTQLPPTSSAPRVLPPIPPTTAPEKAALYASLMAGAHDGLPEGVPSTWGWAQHSEVEDASNAGMSAMTAWGQVYAEAGAAEPPPGTVRVEVRNVRSYVWSRGAGRWALVQDSAGVEGLHYVEDFKANDSKGADMRPEPDGGTSVAMVPGYNFHFWPLSGRAGVAPGDVAAVITTFEARLIGPDAADARYVAKAGGDWWRTLTVPFGGSGGEGNNGGIGEGRFVELTPDWATVGFYTGGP
ncbi:MAG TPA: hypothetical protein VFA84_04565 [Acidimicrobiales bacterium]|nr:hypothetical protein [Acidimicrobiales bacterium]